MKTFESALEAHVLRSRLLNEGIVSFLFDENIITLNPLYNILIGGVKLKVPEKDFLRANSILQEIEQRPFTDDNNQIIKCPSCSSENFYQGFKSMKGVAGTLSAVLTLALGIFPLYFRNSYKCKACGTEFTTNTTKT